MYRLSDAGANQAFFQTLREEHQITSKVSLLDTDFNQIEGGELYGADITDKANDISNLIADGNIDVDTTRGTRRTAELTILNPTAEFTPALEDFQPDGPWVGKIYLNRVVRIYRGLYVGRQPLYVPVGTFLIDACDVEVQQNMSQVVLTMSDMWKKLTKSYFARPVSYPAGTTYNLIIAEFLNAAGGDQPLAPNLDNLNNRATEDKTLGSAIKFEQGDSRGDKLKELAQKWDIDVYFDPLGRFVSQDRLDAKDKAPVFEPGFYSSPDRDGMLLSIKRSFTDDNLYNHVIVIGTGDQKNVVRVQRRDDDPRSKTNIDRIGDRVFLVESDKIKTEDQANKALDRAWKLRFQIGETIDLETICNPALEGDDVIRITERNFAKVDATYRLARFSIPLVTSLQRIQAVNIIRRDDL